MLKKQDIIFIFLSLIALIQAKDSLRYLGNMKHPDLPNHCYYKDYDLTIPVNESLNPTNIQSQCFGLFCRDDFVLQIRYCDNVAPNRNCDRTPWDYSKPYPNCCPIVTCKNY